MPSSRFRSMREADASTVYPFGGNMQIEQKKLSNKHVFEFNDQYLSFSYVDRTGSDSVDIAYGDISKKTSIRREENTWLRNVGILWCLIGLIGPLLKLGGVIWLPVGLVCLVWFHFTKVGYTVLSADKGSIWVIQGKDHDLVLNEIFARRKQQLLSWYGEINPENELDKEIKKFVWLAEQDVITKQEAEQKIAQLRHTSDEVGQSNRLLN